MRGGGELGEIEAGSHEPAEGELPFWPGMAPEVRAMPQHHVEEGIGPGDGIAGGVNEAGGGVQFDQDLQEVVVEAGGIQLQHAGFAPQGQPAAQAVSVQPSGPPGYETLDGLGEEELVAPAEGLEEGSQRGRPGLRQADCYEVEPPWGQGGWYSPLSPPTAAIDALAPSPQRGDVEFIHLISPRCHHNRALRPMCLLALDGDFVDRAELGAPRSRR